MSILTWRTKDAVHGEGLYDVSNGGQTVKKARQGEKIRTVRTNEMLPATFSIELTVDQSKQLKRNKKVLFTFSKDLQVGSKVAFVRAGNAISVSVDGDTAQLQASELSSNTLWFGIATRKVGWQFSLSSTENGANFVPSAQSAATAVCNMTESVHNELIAVKQSLQDAVPRLQEVEQKALFSIEEVSRVREELSKIQDENGKGSAQINKIVAEFPDTFFRIEDLERSVSSSTEEFARMQSELMRLKEHKWRMEDVADSNALPRLQEVEQKALFSIEEVSRVQEELLKIQDENGKGNAQINKLVAEASHFRDTFSRIEGRERSVASSNEEFVRMQNELMRLKEQEDTVIVESNVSGREELSEVLQPAASISDKTIAALSEHANQEILAALPANSSAEVRYQSFPSGIQDAKAMAPDDTSKSLQPDVGVKEGFDSVGVSLARTMTLKLKYNGEMYRVRLQGQTMVDLARAVEQVVCLSFNAVRARYRDEDGDLCVLCKATFSDFVTTACHFCHGCKVFLLEVDTPESHPQDSKDRKEYCNSVAKPCTQQEETLDYASDEEHKDEENATDAESVESQCCSEVRSDNGFLLEGGGHCFVRRTLLQIAGPQKELRHVQSLQVGDRVLSSSGRVLEVASVQRHSRELRQLVTLKTTQAEVTVTMDHRIVMPDYSIQLAKELAVGNIVMCGGRAQRLTKVMQFEERAELVEVRFNPDEPVETLMAPNRGILTKGARLPVALCAKGPLGPFVVEYMNEEIQTGQARRRARSAEI